MDSVPLVEIDNNGAFKYILIKVQNPEDPASQQINIVRGYSRCKWHSDIFEEVKTKLAPLELVCLGGGKICHNPDNKSIQVYGYSQGYGKADHNVTVAILKQFFDNYIINITDTEKE